MWHDPWTHVIFSQFTELKIIPTWKLISVPIIRTHSALTIGELYRLVLALHTAELLETLESIAHQHLFLIQYLFYKFYS